MIVAAGSVPRVDSLSFTAAGRPWLNHEWLAEVIFYGVHRRAGLSGLLVLVAAIATATMYVVHRRMERRGVRPLVALFLLLPGAFAMAGSAGLRIQPVTLLLLAIFLLVLEISREDSRVLAVLPPLMLLWTNLHGGFATGIVAIAIEGAGAAIESRGRLNQRVRRLMLVLLATAATAFIHPHGLGHVLYPLRFLWPNDFTRVINESQRATFRDPIGAVFIALVVLLVLAAAAASRRIRPADLLFILAFTPLAFSQLRHISVWAVTITPILGQLLTHAWRWEDRRDRPLAAAGRARIVLHWVVLAAGVAAFAAIALRYLTPAYVADLERRTYPAAAIEAIARSGTGRNLFSDYRWSGYAIWRLSPRYRTFIDGRADTVYDGVVLKHYFVIRRAEPGWKGLMERYGVDAVLTSPDAPLAAALESEGWQALHRDERAVALVP
jgi:hypothetical protein